MRISDWSSDVCSSDLDEARALAGVSRAGRLPGGGVDASYQRRRLADAERPGGQPREGDALRLGAEASWEVDLFGRVRRGVEAAEAEVGGAEALLRAARAAVTADVAGHYFELRGSRSEEHTSELQSLMRISYAVFCLKTKKQNEK